MTSYTRLKDVLHFARENYRLGYHKAASFAEILLAHEVSVVSELPSEMLLPLHMEAWTSCELEKVIASVAGVGGTVFYMPEASVTVPKAVPDSC